MEAKSSQIPRVRVEPSRRKAYNDAWKIDRKERPDMEFADWLREACDEKAARAKKKQ